MKDFHRRLMFSRLPKSEFAAEPTADDVANLASRVSKHVWRASSEQTHKRSDTND